ncbi:autotransporter outer membrane beta-barrel domain-containing protein [Stenotrophomonas maltophilia]|nr:autotransporter outer membrane beta-barrel domain-containing protein [Stenotrophomonas maltophilia]PJL22071.1 autotransporter outer membrane beta-barrel domain-containing protein [Stenotrophomonas maltophilia]
MQIVVRHALSTALAVCLFSAAPAHAIVNLNPGQSGTANPGETPEDWRLNGATLTMTPGSAAIRVLATNLSTLNMQGAEILGNSGNRIVEIQSSTLTMADSVIENSGARALVIGEFDLSGSNLPGSTVSIARSRITGSGLGLSVSTYNSTPTNVVNLNNTTVEGRARDNSLLNSGNGLVLLGRVDLLAENRSLIIGDAHGIYAQESYTGGTGLGERSTVTIDASRVEGRTGPGILVADPRPSTGDVNTQFVFRNGAQLVGGDGTLLRVDAAAASVGLSIDDSRLTGNIVNTAGSTVNVAVTNNATLLGSTQNITSMAVDNARWQLSGNSSTGTLSLGSGGEIALGDGTAFHTLNVAGNFTGNGGTLAFNTVLAGDNAATDKLIIGGDTSGSANVRVNNIGGAGAQTTQGIELIQVGGASNGQFNLAGRAVGGQYEYFLHKGTGADGNWYLRSALSTVPDPCVTDPTLPECQAVGPGPGPGPGPEPDPELEPVLRPEAGAYLANLHAAQTMFRLGYHDRHAGQNSGRAWVRVDGSRIGLDATNPTLDIRGNNQALTVGADVWRHDSGSNVGVMLSTGNASSTTINDLTDYYARGKVKGEALGLYGTWRGGNDGDPYAGFYVDGSVQRAQFRNRVQGVGLAEERYDSRAWQGAIETGYAFRVGGASNGGIYLEPQLQVGYNRWDGNRHTEANGTVVNTDDANGMYGRAGLRLSGVTRWGNGVAEVQPYLAANWLHARDNSQVRMNDEVVDVRVPRNRGEFSGGASLKFANGIGAWGGLSLQNASGYHQTSVQVGMSYNW